MQKRRAQNIGKNGRILMVEIKDFKKIDKIENLGNKICKFVKYYEEEKGQILKLAALADILLNIKEVFKSYDTRFKKLEGHLKEKIK